MQMHSSDFKWWHNRFPEPERFLGDTCNFNVDFIKVHLQKHACPVLECPLNDFVLEENNSRLMAGGSARTLNVSNIPSKVSDLPAIVAFAPFKRRGTDDLVIWGYDVIDGLHRIAAALRNGRKSMNFTWPPPDISASACQPTPEYMGRISINSNSGPYRLNQKENQTKLDSFYRLIGSEYNFEPLMPYA